MSFTHLNVVYETHSHKNVTFPDIISFFSYITRVHRGIILKDTPFTFDKSYTSRLTLVAIDNGVYGLIKTLGKGAYGTVYKGVNMKNGRYVAIKAQDPRNSDILSQAYVTRKNGIGLCHLCDNAGPAFLSDGRGYFVLPLADCNLALWISRMSVSGDIDKIVKGVIKIGEDLKSLHRNGRVHMDMKIDNVLVLDDICYIADFGKNELIGRRIPSVKNAHHSNHPHCDPMYFVGDTYTVTPAFDTYSYGFLLKSLSRILKRHGNLSFKLGYIGDAIMSRSMDIEGAIFALTRD